MYTKLLHHVEHGKAKRCQIFKCLNLVKHEYLFLICMLAYRNFLLPNPSGAFGCKMSTEWQTHLKPVLFMTFKIGIRNSDSFLQVQITPPLCSFKPLFFS